MDFKTNKGLRILAIYERLQAGYILTKDELADEFAVTPKSIQRDIEDLRAYIADNCTEPMQIKYDRNFNGYMLVRENRTRLSNPEILALCKILMDARAFNKDEMQTMLNKLIESCVPAREKKDVRSLVANERHNYVAPRHGTPLVDRLWQVSAAVNGQKLMRVTYHKMKNDETVTRTLQPVGIMFSEFYFYLLAFIVDENTHEPLDDIYDLYPTIYRLDRIKEFDILDETFKVAYADRFQEGEFRKRVQFMYGGKLKTVKFKYTGECVESILDRLPTANAQPQPDGSYIVTAEVFGKGIDMWLKGQGENVIVIE